MIIRQVGLGRDERGATLTEFGLIAPTLIFMLLGFFELGHQMYATAILRGAVEAAGRDSSLASGPTNAATIDQAVKDEISIVVPDAEFEITRKSYSEYTHVGKPERYTDANDNGQWDAGECLEDINGNGKFDADPSKAGSGGAEDVIFYTVEVQYPRLFPVGSWIGFGDVATISSSTLLKNQPFSDHVDPVVATCG